MENMTRRQVLRVAGSAGTALLASWSELPTVLALGTKTASAASDIVSNTTAVSASLRSEALQSALRFVVYLPAGYSTNSRRYPVIYFLHGLPASPTSYLHLRWVAQALEQDGREAILVVAQGTHHVDGDPEYHNWGSGEDWETALALELPAWIDANYRTIANRDSRAIAGYSAGGYGAAIIGLHHPNEFSVIQSWSGYSRPTDPSGEKTLDVGSAAANAYASVERLVPSLLQQFRQYPTSFAFYVGDSDPHFVPDNTSLDRVLTSAEVPHLFRVYPGGHTATLWQQHAPAWLGLALDQLNASRMV